MAESPVTRSEYWDEKSPCPGRSDHLQRLPPELLERILEYAADVFVLRNLLHTCAVLSEVFNLRSYHILDIVFTRCYPEQIRTMARVTVALESGDFFADLYDLEIAVDMSPFTPRDDPEPIFPFSGTAAMSRRILLLACHADVLARACLENCLLNCKSDGLLDLMPNKLWQNRNCPSLIELQRVTLVLWEIYFFDRLKQACLSGSLNWTADDLCRLQTLSIDTLYCLRAFETQQICTVAGFISTLPNAAAPSAKSAETLSQLTSRYLRETRRLCSKLPIPPPHDSPIWSRRKELGQDHHCRDTMESQGSRNLHWESGVGWQYLNLFMGDKRLERLAYFYHFEKYGFALWDAKTGKRLGLCLDRKFRDSFPARSTWTFLLSKLTAEQVEAEEEFIW